MSLKIPLLAKDKRGESKFSLARNVWEENCHQFRFLLPLLEAQPMEKFWNSLPITQTGVARGCGGAGYVPGVTDFFVVWLYS